MPAKEDQRSYREANFSDNKQTYRIHMSKASSGCKVQTEPGKWGKSQYQNEETELIWIASVLDCTIDTYRRFWKCCVRLVLDGIN